MQCLQPAAAAREGSRREDGLQENYRALALVLTAPSERQASGGLAGSSSAMPLAPSLELRLSWWDDGIYSGAQSSGRHILFGIRDREEEENIYGCLCEEKIGFCHCMLGPQALT